MKSSTIPTEEGEYLLYCWENDGIPEIVKVFVNKNRGVLMCALESIGVIDIQFVHDGLTDVQWDSNI